MFCCNQALAPDAVVQHPASFALGTVFNNCLFICLISNIKKYQLAGRPVDILVMPDGAMLVSDDYGGAITRIAYRG